MQVRCWMMLVLALGGCDRSREPGPPLHPHARQGPHGAASGGSPVTAGPDAGDGSDAPTRPAEGRVPMVAADHPLHDRLEGAGFDNACEGDGGCVRGGCSGEVCSADDGVNTTCDVLPVRFPADAACGCIEQQCQWYSPSDAPLAGEAIETDAPTPSPGNAPDPALVECDGQTCKPGQRCLEYYGIAGPRGPKLSSCEWSCNDGCPPGTRCVTVADGPGKVCR